MLKFHFAYLLHIGSNYNFLYLIVGILSLYLNIASPMVLVFFSSVLDFSFPFIFIIHL